MHLRRIFHMTCCAGNMGAAAEIIRAMAFPASRAVGDSGGFVLRNDPCQCRMIQSRSVVTVVTGRCRGAALIIRSVARLADAEILLR